MCKYQSHNGAGSNDKWSIKSRTQFGTDCKIHITILSLAIWKRIFWHSKLFRVIKRCNLVTVLKWYFWTQTHWSSQISHSKFTIKIGIQIQRLERCIEFQGTFIHRRTESTSLVDIFRCKETLFLIQRQFCLMCFSIASTLSKSSPRYKQKCFLMKKLIHNNRGKNIVTWSEQILYLESIWSMTSAFKYESIFSCGLCNVKHVLTVKPEK